MQFCVAGTPEISVGTQVVIYGIGMSLCFVLSYIYFTRLHRDGRIRDLLQRMDAKEGKFFVPQDDEISYKELQHLCDRCQRYNTAVTARSKVLSHKTPHPSAPC